MGVVSKKETGDMRTPVRASVVAFLICMFSYCGAFSLASNATSKGCCNIWDCYRRAFYKISFCLWSSSSILSRRLEEDSPPIGPIGIFLACIGSEVFWLSIFYFEEDLLGGSSWTNLALILSVVKYLKKSS